MMEKKNRRISFRITALILALICLLFTLILAQLFRYGLTDRWYRPETEGFQNTSQCFTFVSDSLWYVESNLNWVTPSRYDTLGSYGGDAFSFRITMNDKVITDTTKENSESVNSFYYESADGDRYFMEGFVNLPVEPYQGCYAEYVIFDTFFALRYWILAAVILFCILSLLFLFIAVRGNVRSGKNGTLTALSKLPFDVAVLALAVFMLILWYVGRAVTSKIFLYTGTLNYYWLTDRIWSVMTQTLFVGWLYLAGYLLAGQLAGGILGERSLCRTLSQKLSFTWIIVVVGGFHLILCLIVAVLFTNWGGIVLFPALLVICDVAVIIMLLLFMRDGDRIRAAVHAIAEGDLRHKINTGKLRFVWHTLGEELNSIGDGMSAAVDERMRSEQMKTELITNVSHDLKTPLTSIINYVGFLKNDHLTPEQRREYLDVLDRQSQKLRRLTEDVVEASKAASGALPVSMERLDAGELLRQSVGEYEERLCAVGVTPVVELPEHSVFILADGRHLWRVLENLTSNIVKYAMSGTRAYFQLTESDNAVCIAIKNISRESLNIPEEELLERFVRGDGARHREGSGLGLSIAKSLTELMGGTFGLTMDGDLFKAEITFKRMGE